ncbi:MAG: M48 family metalloprotease [Acidobacteria bacterium]|nr:M48 family metalloprotease [Acidobacteriota bacterium]
MKPAAVPLLLMTALACAPLKVENPVTGERQFVAGLTPAEEVDLGRKALPEILKQYGGEDPDPAVRALVKRVGQGVVSRSGAAKSGYPYEFHVLGDRKVLNAFALPGGQVFITRCLLDRLANEAQLAAVLGHEVGHVVARHGAEHMAKAKVSGLLVWLAGAAASNPEHPEHAQRTQELASIAAGLVNLRYGREDELEADALGVRFMSEAAWDPRAMVGVMEVLRKSAPDGRPPEFLSTHPNPENREQRIQDRIREQFPKGVPGTHTLGAALRR